MSASALVCLAPGSEETEAVTTIDLLVRGGIKVTTASVASDGNLAITCSRGVKLLADAPLVEVADGEYGVSFLPLLKGEKVPDWRKSLYYHFYEYPAEHAVRRHYGVRTERYKLMHFYNDIDCWELYDLQEDPMEMHNIYGQPGTEELVKELKTELLRLQVQYDDPIRNIYKD